MQSSDMLQNALEQCFDGALFRGGSVQSRDQRGAARSADPGVHYFRIMYFATTEPTVVKAEIYVRTQRSEITEGRGVSRRPVKRPADGNAETYWIDYKSRHLHVFTTDSSTF
jgi:hypothetical protein